MKQFNKAHLLLIAMLMVVSTSCEFNNQDRSAGGTSEILVVTQNDDQWDGIIGDTIRAYFQQPQYGLPQPEPLYNLAKINASGFNDMFKSHKCLLIVKIDPELSQPKLETNENLWAAPQRVIKITAPNRASWCQFFNEQKETCKALYDQVERDRMLSILRTSKDEKITNRIKNKLGLDMVIPSGFFISRDEPDFMWIRKELSKNSYGIFIYTVPYRDTLQLDGNNLISMRDRMMQKYVPGPTDGSFMTTDKENMPPQIKYISNFPTGFAAEMRGLWCLVGDYMAGPFVSYSFPDNRTGNLVTLEGYVYYPNHDKRNELLQVEALLYSVKIAVQEQEQQKK